ncbi:pyridoxal phosphate-dependent aminotransferase [Aureimonas fodinaquatilis]|uniref:Aminotransferase n=1 Tax=Aureimonas fodinaquatilis TaxID=2565783 RepID=A0A5B0DZE7_9HYPH|nr:pyridoxal phosphate-dependent aminotransferase [Aureimonas fodinaquatilis]KAA0970920.1 pyridoxal phosphate-dependent aminotransferase [Aureimonas fodinaquatilis]
MSLKSHLRPGALAAPESGIVSLVNYARNKPGLIPLWVGEGDMPTPAFIAQAATQSLAAGETFYTWQRGLPELRQALATYTQNLYGFAQTPDRFFVTGSGMHAIHTVVTALAGQCDELVYIGPLWPNFAAAANLSQAQAIEVLLDQQDGAWHLDLDRLKAAISPRTKAIFVNTPNNPTGWTADVETLRGILDIAREAGVFIIADEIYSRFYYAGGRAPSFHDVMTVDDAVIFVNSFSKNWAMTGWRVGWIEAPAEFGDLIENLVQYSTSGVAAFMQRAATAALEEGEVFLKSQIERATKARAIFCEALLATNRVQLAMPSGAFYAFFAIDGVQNARAAAMRIVDEANVGLAPGGAFGNSAPNYMRACFHRRLDEVEEAADRLTGWIRRAL